jgi:hypothetical protein
MRSFRPSSQLGAGRRGCPSEDTLASLPVEICRRGGAIRNEIPRERTLIRRSNQASVVAERTPPADRRAGIKGLQQSPAKNQERDVEVDAEARDVDERCDEGS